MSIFDRKHKREPTDENRRIVCPECGGRLRYSVGAEVEYSVNPKTGEQGDRILVINLEAHGETFLRCLTCQRWYDFEQDDDGNISRVLTDGRKE